jgi:hypothetical protein
MTIGRTEDPENPFGAQAFQGRPSVWDWIADPIWASGHEPRQQAEHMIAVDPPVKLIFPLAFEGPSTHAPTPRNAHRGCRLQYPLGISGDQLGLSLTFGDSLRRAPSMDSLSGDKYWTLYRRLTALVRRRSRWSPLIVDVGDIAIGTFSYRSAALRLSSAACLGIDAHLPCGFRAQTGSYETYSA